MLGQTARFERFMAELMYVVAAERKIDTDRMPRFSEQVEAVFKNPFEKKKAKKMTAEEIKQYIWNKLEEAKQWT